MIITSGPSARTLEIRSDAIPVILGRAALEPVRLAGFEGINKLFEYQLLVATPDSLNIGASEAADFDLDSFIGREITCTIQLDGSGTFLAGADHVGAGIREISALITDAQMWGEEGRHVQYQLTLRPWLHLATLSTDHKIYQDKTAVDILDELLSDYAFPVDKRLIEKYPQRDFQTQFGESDFAFFSRITQEWGISYFFEHSDGEHRLVLIDNMGAHKQNASAAYQDVEYHQPGWKIDAEYIHSFVPHNQLTSGQFSTREYDYTRPRSDLSISQSAPRPTGQAGGEVYQWHDGMAGAHYVQPRAGNADANDPQAEGRQLALLRMQALRTHGARAKASGNLRGMVPGCSFKLQEHPRQAANAEYLILDTHFLIEDVAQDSQIKDAAPDRKQGWRVQVDFTVHPMIEPLRPAMTQAKPYSRGPQPALVVGPAGQNLWTDELGRIKVQFPWDRIGQKNQNSTCWLRVSSPWAGNQLGAVHIPRIGQEVIVDFFGGDPDLPICTGRVHNQMNLPPWALPGQSALSGIRSRELTAEGGNSSVGRSNHLVMDDTAGELQAQLKSDHQHSQLSLGKITRIEDNAGRKDPRGEGFDLRTDGHGVVRAAEGLMLTTEARMSAEGHIKDLGAIPQRLTNARALIEGQSEAARTSRAQIKGDQDVVAKAIKALNGSIQGSGGDPKTGQFPELQEPHLVLASPSGIAVTSGGSTHIASNEHTQVTSAKHISLNSGQSLIAVALEAFKVYAMENGMEMIAAQADIEIKALNNSIKMMAKEKIELVADEITIIAKTKLTLNGGGSYEEYKVGAITKGTTGKYTNNAKVHSFVPQDSKDPAKPKGEGCGTKEQAGDSGGGGSVARS
jgi:type VI secretion system secreted protein VgrG